MIEKKYLLWLVVAGCIVLSTLLLLATEASPPHSPETAVKVRSWTEVNKQGDKLSPKFTNIAQVTFSDNVDGGLRKAVQAKKLLLVFMKKPGCPHCAFFESKILTKPDVANFLNNNFVCARVFRQSSDPEILESSFGCHAYPHFVVFANNGQLIGRWFGQPKDSDNFIADARRVARITKAD